MTSSKQQDADPFSDIAPPLNHNQALIESSRCYYCYDAPCMEACPTGINIPGFIAKINQDNPLGAAKEILSDNIMGGTCSRACPVETLCEEACVRTTQQHKPVKIGMLQRYATDTLFEKGEQPFTRAANTGKRIAVVGAGPAGLSCAHGLAQLGHQVFVYDSKPKGGGLNEYGLAAYKMVDDFAQKELAFILSIGNIEFCAERILGTNLSLADLRRDHDAVFLGLGLAGVNALNIEGEEFAGVSSAVDYIAQLRQTDNRESLPVGRDVVVIGGGNTAIDIASQVKRLGAKNVTIVYRRGQQHMGATEHEQHVAKDDDASIKYWAQPRRIIGENNQVQAMEFEYTQLDNNNRLMGTGDTFTIKADTVFKAIGQHFIASPIEDNANDLLELQSGRIAVNADRQTSLPDVFAGGDCIYGGEDLTVQAVQDGKIAAQAIHQQLTKG